MNHQNKISYVIYYMCRGLESPTVKVDMMTYGDDSAGHEYHGEAFRGPICAGCAATNAFLVDHPEAIHDYRSFVDSEIEDEIDQMRLADPTSACLTLSAYFGYTVSEREVIRNITVRHEDTLEELDNDYTLEQLKAYRALADDLYLAGF